MKVVLKEYGDLEGSEAKMPVRADEVDLGPRDLGRQSSLHIVADI